MVLTSPTLTQGCEQMWWKGFTGEESDFSVHCWRSGFHKNEE